MSINRFCKRFAIIWSLIIPIFTAGCRDKTSPNAITGKKEAIKIAAYTGEMSALVLLAESEGLFAKYGIDAQVTGFETGVAAVNAVLAGTHDVATASDFVFVRKELEHTGKLKIFGSICNSDSIEIIARNDRGISSPSDLKGKKIALVRKTAPEYYLDLYLLYHHVDPRTVTIVDLTPPLIAKAIEDGDVDAVIIWEPNAWNIQQKLDGKVRSWSAQSDQQFYFLLISSSEFAEKRPEAAKRLFQALADAEKLIIKDPEKVKKILAKLLKVDERYLVSVWPKHQLRLSLNQALLVVMEEQLRWAVNKGLATAGQAHNYLSSIIRGPLVSVTPQAVTLYE